MLKKSFIIIALWLNCCANLSAQLQNNIWSFGYDHGAFLDFTNPSAPVLSPSNMYAVEGCASVCDPNTGQLMFYTNGNIVHDRNMNPMPNGSGLLGNGYGSEFDHGSGAQGVMIVPFQPGKYYIFEIDPNVVNPGYLQYSIVDMALNGGLGDVVAGKKNIIVGEGYCEGMATVVGDNCNIWLLVQKRGPNWMGRELAAFSIGVTGLNPTPVISNCGSIAHWTLNPSVDGTMVSGASAVYRFNKTTGQFSPLIPVITE